MQNIGTGALIVQELLYWGKGVMYVSPHPNPFFCLFSKDAPAQGVPLRQPTKNTLPFEGRLPDNFFGLMRNLAIAVCLSCTGFQPTHCVGDSYYIIYKLYKTF